MKQIPQLVVMLTHNDHTVENAFRIFDECKNTKAKYWGFKEIGIPKSEMKELFAYMHSCGKITSLEVVVYNEEDGLAGARLAAECGCDYLMGTMYSDRIMDFCRANSLKYFPFVGNVTQRPSILNGSIDDMAAQARACIEKGACGIDLLGYRYTGDAAELNRRIVEETPAPVCIAGSVNSYQRLDELKKISPWSFTIGGAFFNHCFGESFGEQINRVCEYMEQ